MGVEDESAQGDHDVLLRQYLDSRAEDQRHLGRLEDATLRLSKDVGSLQAALSTYATREEVETAAATAVLAQREERLQELVALRLRIRRRANVLFGIAIALILAAVAVGGWVLHVENDNRHRACVQRNNAAKQANIFYTQQINALEAKHGDPAVIDVLKAAQKASQHSVVKC